MWEKDQHIKLKDEGNMKFKTKEAVHKRAQQIENIKQKDLIKQLHLHIKGNKNAMGDIFEAWFGKLKDSSSKPDLGVAELKATPFKRLKNNSISAKERLVLNIINYDKIDTETFADSHLLQKNKVLELAFYEYNNNIPKDDWYFAKCVTYEMLKDKKDIKIIQKDWETIQSYVKNGHAEDINEGLTNYLAACTKGKNKHSLRSQPHSDVMAKQRAFSFKGSFMTTLLRNYIFGNQHSNAIIKDADELNNKTLEEAVYDRFKPYIGRKVEDIIDELNIPVKKTSTIGKYNVMIVNKILGIRGKRTINADEFEKASIVPKTIQFNYQNNNKESMSLPPFKFKDLVKENWEDEDGNPAATLNTYFTESKFLFVVFKSDQDGTNYLQGVKFFKVPAKDKNGIIKQAWQQTINTLNEGVQLTYDTNRRRVSNNLISSKDRMIIHVRPHASHSSYVDNADSNPLPAPAHWINKPEGFSDNFMTTQSFWINNEYIKEAVKDLL